MHGNVVREQRILVYFCLYLLVPKALGRQGRTQFLKLVDTYQSLALLPWQTLKKGIDVLRLLGFFKSYFLQCIYIFTFYALLSGHEGKKKIQCFSPQLLLSWAAICIRSKSLRCFPCLALIHRSVEVWCLVGMPMWNGKPMQKKSRQTSSCSFFCCLQEHPCWSQSNRNISAM